MNGEMHQICSITAAAKKALADNSPIKYTPMKYEKSIAFSCLNLDNTDKYTAKNVFDWFNFITKRGLSDIKFLCPVSVKERNILGFVNTNGSCILCFFYNNLVTYFTSHWEFDSEEKKWSILYSEKEWINPPSGKPRFENNKKSLKKILTDIGDFAVKIGADNFARIFEKAKNILDGSEKYPYERIGYEPLPIPSENLELFEAASIADVFGAMGSWNDEPPYMAEEKGLRKEYEALSSELLKNLRLAALYAVNEW